MHLSALLFGVLYFAVTQQPVASPDSITLSTCQIVLNDKLDLPAQEAGIIREIRIKEGDMVRIGDALVLLDDDLPLQQVKVAAAELEVAKFQAENKIPRLYAAETLKVAKAEYALSEEANRKVRGAVPPAMVNQLRLKITEAELSIEKADQDTEIAKKQVNVSEAKLEAAKIALKHRSLSSTLNGQVREIKKFVGEWVTNGETVLQVVQMDILRVQGRVKPSEASPAELLGRTAVIKVPLARGHVESVQGKIVFVDPVVEADGMFVVRAEITNPVEKGQYLLRKGMSAVMTIDLR
jgi:multidrug efflux pump subunit AcrA (membrane-fusion protein)